MSGISTMLLKLVYEMEIEKNDVMGLSTILNFASFLLKFFLAIVILGFLFFGCKQEPPVDNVVDVVRQVPDNNSQIETGAKVFLLAIDGADWYAINKFIDQGLLPNFKKLIKTGASGILKTDFGDSPVTWTTIATGVNCEKHGICPPKETGQEYNTSFQEDLSSIRYPRIWEVLPKFKKTSRTVNYFFLSGDSEKVSVMGPENQNEIHPITAKADSRLGFKTRYDINGNIHILYGEINKDLLSRISKEKLAYGKKVDFYVSHFQNIDQVSHSEWGFFKLLEQKDTLDPRLLKRAQIAEKIIADVYIDIDQMVGRIRRAYPDSLIVLCSDHGFLPTDFQIAFYLQEKLLTDLGIGKGDDQGKTIKLKNHDATITITTADKLFRSLKTNVVFTFPSMLFRGPDAKLAAKEAMVVLKKIKLFDKKVFKMESETKIVVDSSWEDNWYQYGPVTGALVLFSSFNGTHYAGVDGVIILNGPGVNPGYKIQEAGVIDVAPTIYAYLGVPLAKDLDGKTLVGAFDKNYLPGIKLPKVKTYGIAPNYRKDSANQNLSPDEINRLKSLGYIQ